MIPNPRDAEGTSGEANPPGLPHEIGRIGASLRGRARQSLTPARGGGGGDAMCLAPQLPTYCRIVDAHSISMGRLRLPSSLVRLSRTICEINLVISPPYTVFWDTLDISPIKHGMKPMNLFPCVNLSNFFYFSCLQFWKDKKKKLAKIVRKAANTELNR